MAVGPRLDLRQSPNLVMTPQLQQAIKLLQMTNLELSAYIEEQIEQNPLLEREDPDGGPDTEPAASETEGEGGDDDPPEVADAAELANSDTLLENDAAALDADYENVWGGQAATDGDAVFTSAGGGAGSGGEDGPDLENIASEAETLRDHLLAQVSVDLSDPVDRVIAAHLIELLDDNGYLTEPLESVAARLGCEVSRVERTLERVKGFDPAGVFAASLGECLALQLRDRNRLDPSIQALLDNLDLLARRDFAALRRVCNADNEDLAEMIDEIKALNPKPASAFDHEVAEPVVPDVLVRRSNDGWIVELNNDTLPRVLVNNRYYATVAKKARSKAEKQYLVDSLHSANWLAKSLQQRAQTILKVATELVDQQSEFFMRGVQHLRPLTLRDVAEAVGVHESTVSRVTNNKYLGMSRGIYEMKYFFTSGIGQADTGEAHSAEAVRHRIKTLINDETADSVLSDDMIVNILRGDGVDIARRTVAKYRESMRIPSSVQRRREKALHA